MALKERQQRLVGLAEEKGHPITPLPDATNHPDKNVSAEASQQHIGRRIVVHIAVVLLLIGIILGTLVFALPAGSRGGGDYLQSNIHVFAVHKRKMLLIAAQAATATAVTVDGYEYNGAGGLYHFAGVNYDAPSGLVPDINFVNPFTMGQCTYWADYRYHQLTGYAVTWSGNADAWAYGAANTAGWNVSSQPHLHAIIVLQAGVQGASGVGHVAVVERINPDGSVVTSNWNVRGWKVLSYETYRPGPGVSFIWHA
ncbi:MAG TPA: CHAP domain-containing protein [Dictyobacter sp.]|jgi:surface antigen|nr:CHAP domain-containing protein [Dictyobacter sp.]